MQHFGVLNAIQRTISLLQKGRTFVTKIQREYDAIVVGGGHNGLVSAFYLAQKGVKVAVLEKRHILGGAAVTEEIVPGFKFSRCSYLLSLLRPIIVKELDLYRHGLKVILRDPNSYTPLRAPAQNGATSLTLGRDGAENQRQIAQFSKRDAAAFPAYEEELSRIVDALEPLLDSAPVYLPAWSGGSLKQKAVNWAEMKALVKSARKLNKDAAVFYEYLTAPASKVLDRWFESEPLKATLATDSVIGAMTSSYLPNSGYVLLHHVMGELEGVRGAWGYAVGGMGAVSDAIASAAREAGAELFTDCNVAEIAVKNGNTSGVVLDNGQEINAKIVLSNATPEITFLRLIDKNNLPDEFVTKVRGIDYTSPVTKINMAVNALPNFTANPNESSNRPMPHHRATIHLNCEDSSLLHNAYLDCQNGNFSKHPVIEMTIPSSVDATLAPPGCHVVQFFTQYTPYSLHGDGTPWTAAEKDAYLQRLLADVDVYAPGFSNSVVGVDLLTPSDLEDTFGLTGGNIFHAAMGLDQLYSSRPFSDISDSRTPISGLYMCGSSVHPGGGVMGSPGRLAAKTVLKDLKKSTKN